MIKILIDENIDVNLISHLSDFNVHTVTQMGWKSKKNGELIKLAFENEFTHFLTIDKNLRHQQNLGKYPLNFIILNTPSSKLDVLIYFIPKLKEHLSASATQKLIFIDL